MWVYVPPALSHLFLSISTFYHPWPRTIDKACCVHLVHKSNSTVELGESSRNGQKIKRYVGGIIKGFLYVRTGSQKTNRANLFLLPRFSFSASHSWPERTNAERAYVGKRPNQGTLSPSVVYHPNVGQEVSNGKTEPDPNRSTHICNT